MTNEDQFEDERAPEPDPAELLKARKKHLETKLKARGLIKSDDPARSEDAEERSEGA